MWELALEILDIKVTQRPGWAGVALAVASVGRTSSSASVNTIIVRRFTVRSSLMDSIDRQRRIRSSQHQWQVDAVSGMRVGVREGVGVVDKGESWYASGWGPVLVTPGWSLRSAWACVCLAGPSSAPIRNRTGRPHVAVHVGAHARIHTRLARRRSAPDVRSPATAFRKAGVRPHPPGAGWRSGCRICRPVAAPEGVHQRHRLVHRAEAGGVSRDDRIDEHRPTSRTVVSFGKAPGRALSRVSRHTSPYPIATSRREARVVHWCGGLTACRRYGSSTGW